MSKAEPRWKRHCQFLAALNDDNTSLAWTLLCGFEGPPVDPDVRIMTGGESKPAICIAVEKDLIEMAQLLIMRGCSVNQFSATGLSPLHIAVMRNNIALVRLLLKNGASVSCVDSNGRTPLHHLAVCNYSGRSLEMARLLVQKGSNKKYRDRSGATPLALACQSNRTLALFLLSLGDNASAADNEGNTPLHHACARQPNDVELVDRLLAAGAPVNRKNNHGMTALSFALMAHASPLLVQSLMSKGADCNLFIECWSQTVLHRATCIASNYRDLEPVKTFVRYGGNPFSQDGFGTTVMQHALCSNRPLALWMIRANPYMGAPRWAAWRMLNGKSERPDHIVASIMSELSSIPTLQQLCSLAFRRKYACHLDSPMYTSILPPRLLQCLLLSDLWPSEVDR
ncbi:ankyrin repeat domain-containing protein 65-like isoform X1 [Dermacentor albipictus]|uniref:ankyrin repeat domain-containing protein 65-like isoform X1 n=2 Tax=Dermacentor albipictus TaxID=60249 RepID=UPI0031FC4F47